ncbi:MAG: rubredoxin, partial [Cytophagales bacterium]
NSHHTIIIKNIMKVSHVVKINALGGILSPSKLKEIVQIAFKHGAANINFGPRQEVFFNIHKEALQGFCDEMLVKKFEFEFDQDHSPNIISSYPSENILSGENWLTEGIYKDVFDQFDFQPRLKINIVDNDQCLVPFFSGELNFIASNQYQYWYLYINIRKNGAIFRWNRLIYSTDIARISNEIEELYFNNKITDLAIIMDLVNENAKYLFESLKEELVLPRFVFPYYEGMNKYGSNFWLGIYRRDYLFPIQFVFELCVLCSETNIGQICITPWRTLIIKGIEQKDRIKWEKLLGKHGINLRHSSTELNWLIEDINSRELDLKKYIVSQLDQKDTRTFGLVFGIKLQSNDYIPASVIIEEKPLIHKDDLRLFSNYDIYYTENFNPNSPNKILFAKNISKNNVINKLLELTKRHSESMTELSSPVVIEKAETKKELSNIILHQCKHCFTVYDLQFGDELQNIKPGISFVSLPQNYHCPTCEAPKSAFIEIFENNLINT